MLPVVQLHFRDRCLTSIPQLHSSTGRANQNRLRPRSTNQVPNFLLLITFSGSLLLLVLAYRNRARRVRILPGLRSDFARVSRYADLGRMTRKKRQHVGKILALETRLQLSMEPKAYLFHLPAWSDSGSKTHCPKSCWIMLIARTLIDRLFQTVASLIDGGRSRRVSTWTQKPAALHWNRWHRR